MDYRRPGIGSFERCIGDCFGRDRDRRMLANRVSRTGNRAGDDHPGIHSVPPLILTKRVMLGLSRFDFYRRAFDQSRHEFPATRYCLPPHPTFLDDCPLQRA
jgi:hypothetical protein